METNVGRRIHEQFEEGLGGLLGSIAREACGGRGADVGVIVGCRRQERVARARAVLSMFEELHPPVPDDRLGVVEERAQHFDRERCTFELRRDAGTRKRSHLHRLDEQVLRSGRLELSEDPNACSLDLFIRRLNCVPEEHGGLRETAERGDAQRRDALPASFRSRPEQRADPRF
jgi:hypothetical protein